MGGRKCSWSYSCQVLFKVEGLTQQILKERKHTCCWDCPIMGSLACTGWHTLFYSVGFIEFSFVWSSPWRCNSLQPDTLILSFRSLQPAAVQPHRPQGARSWVSLPVMCLIRNQVGCRGNAMVTFCTDSGLNRFKAMQMWVSLSGAPPTPPWEERIGANILGVRGLLGSIPGSTTAERKSPCFQLPVSKMRITVTCHKAGLPQTRKAVGAPPMKEVL